MCRISSKKRVKCSNSSCHFVYQFQDIIHPLINDKGYVVFKCPNCGHCTKTKVNNTDIYDSHPNFYNAYEFDEYTDDIIEVDSINDDFKSEHKIIVENKIWDTESIDFYKRCQSIIHQNHEKISKELKNIEDAYLALRHYSNIERLIFKINLEGQECLLIKKISSERDFTTDNLVFIGTNELKIKSLANGVYDRDYCYNILDNALRRWNVLSNQIVFVSPFIGFAPSATTTTLNGLPAFFLLIIFCAALLAWARSADARFYHFRFLGTRMKIRGDVHTMDEAPFFIFGA